VALAVTVVVVALAIALLASSSGTHVVSRVGGWGPGAGVAIALVSDAASAGFAVLAAVLVAAGLVFTWRYFEEVGAFYSALVLVFLGAVCGFVLSADLFDMFVFFELMGASAYVLTGYRTEEPQSVQGAFNFGVVNTLGASFSLVGIALVYARTGQLGLAPVAAGLHGHERLAAVALALICTGFLVKAAAVPFHFWTADAEAVAPSPICVLFSAVMVEVGVYATARVYLVTFAPVLPAEGMRNALLGLGVLTALTGSMMCLLQHHIKRLLAFSTIAHVGVFLAGLAALDAHSATAFAWYVLGNAGVKCALFLAAGVLLNRLGTLDERALHGRGRDLPVTGTTFLLAGLFLAGLPPGAAWVGKVLAESSAAAAGTALHGSLTVVFLLVSGLTGGSVLRVWLRVFRGTGSPAPGQHEVGGADAPDEPETTRLLTSVPWTMLAPALAVFLPTAVLGVVPGAGTALAEAGSAMLDGAGVRGAVLGTGPRLVRAVPAETPWTTEGVLTGLAALVLALAVAMASVRKVDVVIRAAQPLAPALDALRRVHSGHIGDYAAWLTAGFAGLALVLVVPLL
jgi:multicomponent Na+:H+ antiporter subunit D